MNSLRKRLRKNVIATMKDGSSFRGVLFEADRVAFVFRNVEHLDVKTSRATPIDGELLVLAGDIAFVQFL